MAVDGEEGGGVVHTDGLLPDMVKESHGKEREREGCSLLLVMVEAGRLVLYWCMLGHVRDGKVVVVLDLAS